MEREELLDRQRRENPVIKDGEFQYRFVRVPEPLSIIRSPHYLSTFWSISSRFSVFTASSFSSSPFAVMVYPYYLYIGCLLLVYCVGCTLYLYFFVCAIFIYHPPCVTFAPCALVALPFVLIYSIEYLILLPT
jgi:hypothetical protein